MVTVGIVIQPTRHYVPAGAGVRAFRSANVGENRVVDRDWAYISHEGHAANDKSALKAGDVLVVRSGAPGTACVVTPEFAGTNCIDVVIARPRPAEVLPEFLAEFTNSSEGRRQVADNQGGLALQHFNVGAYKKVQLNLPSVDVQRSILSIIHDWNAAIEKTERLIAATAKRHESLLVRLLGRRLWASSHHERADVLFTPISERNRPELPVLAVTQDQGVVPRSTLDRRIAMDLSDPATFKVVRKDDFVISLRSFQGGLEHSAYEGLVSPAYTVLSCRAGVEPAFYRHYLKSPDFLKRLSVAVVGIRDGKQINFADFASIQLPLPVRPQQASLAAALDASEAELAVVKRQADALRRQKRGLMQKLLTGQWRLPAPANSPEECSSC